MTCMPQKKGQSSPGREKEEVGVETEKSSVDHTALEGDTPLVHKLCAIHYGSRLEDMAPVFYPRVGDKYEHWEVYEYS